MKIDVSLETVFDVVRLLDDDRGTVGWLVREKLADALERAPTESDVRAYVEAKLQRAVGGSDEDWWAVASVERPIAVFLSLWTEAGVRCRPYDAAPRWLLTPKMYRTE
jgi:hypothetical protein